MTMRPRSLVLALAVLLAACSPGKSEGAQSTTAASYASAPKHAESNLPVVPLTVTAKNGKHAFKVEVAQSDAEQEKGLMFRTAMGADEGMIFPSERAETRAFWMKNTVIPLDIIYVGADRRILNIVDAKPYDETPLYSAGRAIAVLELNAGRSAQLGIAAGDKVDW